MASLLVLLGLSEEVTLQLQSADIASGEDQEGGLRIWTETQCSGPGRTQVRPQQCEDGVE